MAMTKDDYLVAVLQGKCRVPTTSDGRISWRNLTFEEWQAKQKRLQGMKDSLKAALDR